MSNENKTFSVIFITKSHKEKYNQLSVYTRITVDASPNEISMKQWVIKDQWNFQKGMAKENSKMANDLNRFLKRASGKVLNDYKELLLNNHIFTSEVLKRKFLGLNENSKTPLELIDYHKICSKLRVKVL